MVSTKYCSQCTGCLNDATAIGEVTDGCDPRSRTNSLNGRVRFFKAGFVVFVARPCPFIASLLLHPWMGCKRPRMQNSDSTPNSGLGTKGSGAQVTNATAAILLGGLSVGVLDTLLAMSLWHVTPVTVYKSVAGGWLGREAFH